MTNLLPLSCNFDMSDLRASQYNHDEMIEWRKEEAIMLDSIDTPPLNYANPILDEDEDKFFVRKWTR